MTDAIQALTIDALSHATEAADTDVVITLEAEEGKSWIIPGLIYSYSDLPGAVGGVVIDDGANTIDFDVSDNALHAHNFAPHVRGALGAEVTVTLKAAGAGVIGKLNIVPAPYQQG
jgi:hypothetical protein